MESVLHLEIPVLFKENMNLLFHLKNEVCAKTQRYYFDFFCEHFIN